MLQKLLALSVCDVLIVVCWTSRQLPRWEESEKEI